MALATKIDHIAIAVKELEPAVRTFTANFGFPVSGRAEVPAAGIRLALLQVGDAQLELFTPTAEGTPAGKALAERGEGMHVLSLETPDLDAAIAALSAKGIKVGPALPSADGRRLAFLSPRHTHGVMLQLIEAPASAAS